MYANNQTNLIQNQFWRSHMHTHFKLQSSSSGSKGTLSLNAAYPDTSMM